MKTEKNKIILCILWFIEGIVVGFGAILPGVSGGTLCVAFGMYRPIVETLSDIKKGIKSYWLMLGVFFLGAIAGFVGLSGLAAMLLEKNTALVTYVFIGFIIGTFPELWKDAGTEGRTKLSVVSMISGFSIMLGILTLLKTTLSLTVAPDIFGYLLCGLLWGLSFIVPGLSSSSLLLFFGLYQPMLEGISKLDFSVLIPMGIGMAACVLLLSKAVGFAYKKYFSTISHAVLGIVAATAIMILPPWDGSRVSGIINFAFILGGAVISYIFTRVCDKLKA
ncbi:MAG: DUF368 domain-containing protein [Oscillospiraceae bacterium]|nr:DUF368 domain-containing protein [Oscillospiraceae bacterium]